MDIEPHLMEKWAENQRTVEAVWRPIAESQVSHLAGRPRRQDGTAVKSRKRRAPTAAQPEHQAADPGDAAGRTPAGPGALGRAATCSRQWWDRVG